MFWFGIESLYTSIRRIPPKWPSCRKSRIAIAEYIAKNYPDARTVIDIGANFGGMCRKIALRNTNMKVHGIEFMPLSWAMSQFCNLFGLRQRNMYLHYGDAKKFLAGKKFDIAVCYLLPSAMKKLQKPLRSSSKIIIALDFPFPGVKPVKTIKLHSDFMKNPHKMFVYNSKDLK
jgi:SAM-dependent methyltransferase